MLTSTSIASKKTSSSDAAAAKAAKASKASKSTSAASTEGATASKISKTAHAKSIDISTDTASINACNVVTKKFKTISPVRSKNITEVVFELRDLLDSLSSLTQDDVEASCTSITTTATTTTPDLEPDSPLIRELHVVAQRCQERDLLSSADKTIRLLVSNVISTLLRLLAPNSPFHPTLLPTIFSLLFSSLQHLPLTFGSSTANGKDLSTLAFLLLESLSTVKSHLLILSIQSPDPLIKRMIKVSFDVWQGGPKTLSPTSTPRNLPHHAKFHIEEMLSSFIDEWSDSTPLPFWLIDLLLENQNTLAIALLNKIPPLHATFSAYLKKPAAASGGAASTKAGSVPLLIERLTTLIPLLAEVSSSSSSLPSTTSLPTKTTKTPLDSSVEFMCRLLLESCNDCQHRCQALKAITTILLKLDKQQQQQQHHQTILCKAFLHSSNDRLKAVRLEWLKGAQQLLQQQQQHQQQQPLLPSFLERLSDSESAVREGTLVVLKANIASVLLEPHALLEEILLRCRDRAEVVRFAAMDLSTSLVQRAFAEYYQCNNDNDNDSNSNSNNDKKKEEMFVILKKTLKSMFSLLFSSEKDLRLFYAFFLEHSFFLPVHVKSSTTDATSETIKRQATLLSLLYDKILTTKEDRAALQKWMTEKALFVRYFSALLSLMPNAQDPRIPLITQHLSHLFRMPSEAQDCLQGLVESVGADERGSGGGGRQLLLSLTAPGTMEGHRLVAEKALSLDWKAKYGDARLHNYLMTYLIRRASMAPFTTDLIMHILSSTSTCTPLYEALIASFPSLVMENSLLLEEKIIGRSTVASSNLKESLVIFSKLLKLKSTTSPSPSTLVRREVIDSLKALTQDAKYAKLAWTCLIRAGFGDGISLETEEPDWMALSELALCSPHLFQSHHHLSTLFLRTKICVSEYISSLCGGGGGDVDDDDCSGDDRSDRYKTEKTEKTDKTKAGKTKISNWIHLTTITYKPLRDVILSLKFNRNILLSLAPNGEDRLEHMRRIAPFLMKSLRDLCNSDANQSMAGRVMYELAKMAILTIPRPPLRTLLHSMAPMIDYLTIKPGLLSPVHTLSVRKIQMSPASLVIKNYLLGNVGMSWLLVSLVKEYFNILVLSSSALRKKKIAELRKALEHCILNDHNTIPMEEKNSITSKKCQRWEDFFLLCLIAMSCLAPTGAKEAEMEDLLVLLCDCIITSSNASIIFDGVVQLKRYCISDYGSGGDGGDVENNRKNRTLKLWVSSERCQAIIRSKSSHWVLGSSEVELDFSDEDMLEIAEDHQVNLSIRHHL